MKIFNQINNVTMKIAKGMVAIFAIKLALVIIIITFNACSTENIENSKNNSSEFQNALDLSMSNIGKISTFNTLEGMARTNEESKTLYLINNNEQTFNNTDFLNSVTDLQSLITIKNGRSLTLAEEDPMDINEILASYTIDEQPIVSALQPAIQEAKNYLYELGLTDAEISVELQGGDESDLVLAVMALKNAESNHLNSTNLSNNYQNLFGFSIYAQEQQQDNTLQDSGPDWYDCLLRSVGIDAVIELFNGKVTKAIAKKAIRKIVSRTLGWVGAAIAVYEYGDCMGWY